MTHLRPQLPTLALLALATAALLVPAAVADTLITVESRQKLSIDGDPNPERQQTVQIWISDHAIARDDAQSRTVLAGDELLLIDHFNRKYSRLKLPLDPLQLMPAEMRDLMRDQLDESKLSGELTASDETREVGDWATKRYDLKLSSENGLSVDTVLWAAPAVKTDAGRYNALVRALASMQLGGGEWVDKLAAVEGFPVLRETTMINEMVELHTSEEVTSIEEATAPAGTYGPPTGYTEAELPAAELAPPPPEDPATAPPAEEN